MMDRKKTGVVARVLGVDLPMPVACPECGTGHILWENDGEGDQKSCCGYVIKVEPVVYEISILPEVDGVEQNEP